MAREQRSKDMASFIEVQRHLAGASYPAEKEELIEVAEGHDAPPEVMEILRRLDERRYESPAEVSKAIGRVDG
jgi:hypothetical protein